MKNIVTLRGLVVIALTVSTAGFAEDLPAVPPFLLKSVEEKYSADVAKAEAEVAKAEASVATVRKVAGAVRLKTYKDRLVEVTKSGDFDKAQQVKARINQLEKEPESATEKIDNGNGKPKRPKPKDVVKHGGHVYAMINDKVTWHIAKQRCEEMGGHLACINTSSEEAFIAKLCGSTTAWIGASDEENEGKWVNVDGTVPSFTSKVLFDNASNAEHWMTWDGISQHFNDLSTAKIAYICEWDR